MESNIRISRMAAERSEALARLFAQAKSVTIAMTVACVC